MFLQPDWWEVMQPGVGTNRYSYSFGDPVNGIDPTGHERYTQAAKNDARFGKMKEVAQKARDALTRDIVAKRSIEARMASNEKLGWFAQLGWTNDERLAFKLITKVAGGTRNVTLGQIETSRARSEKVLSGIGLLGSGLMVDYTHYKMKKDGSASKNVTGYARPFSGKFTWTDFGIGGQEINGSTRTLVHESGHAVLGLLDELEGYGGPAGEGVTCHIPEGDTAVF